MKIGYARVSTSQQDLPSQIDALKSLGVDEDNIHVDPGLTGKNRERPGLRAALAAASRPGDVLVVTKMDRLARSVKDLHNIAERLAEKGVGLSIGGSLYDPNDPFGKLMFNVLAMVAKFEGDLIRARTREGMQVAKAKGLLRGKQPKLSKTQEKQLVELWEAGQHATSDLAKEFGVARSTVYRAVDRAGKSKA